MKGTIPVISLIVPVYNMERYLSRCLDSLITQDYAPLEIICIDDGSTDASGEILRAYAGKDPRIKIIAQANQGLSAARNAGLAAAHGEWIGFVDSDDYIAPNTFKQLAPLLNKRIELLCWGIQVVPQQGEKDIPWLTVQAHHLRCRFAGAKAFTPQVAQKTPVTVWNKLFRHSIIKNNNILFPKNVLFEDNAFYWKYFPFCKNAYFLREKLYFYTQRRKSIMGRLFFKQLSGTADACLAGKDLIDFYRGKGLFEKYQLLLQRIYFGLFLLDFDHTIDSQRAAVLEQAANILHKYPFTRKTPGTNAILSRNIGDITAVQRMGFWKKIFSVSRNSKGEKYVCILGLKLWI